MPTTRPTVFVVEPTGYADFVHTDKDAWCLFVVDGGSEHGWSVRRGTPGSHYVLNRRGEWVLDQRRYRRHRRFPLREALALANQHVDTLRLGGLTAAEASAVIAARLAAQATA